MFLDVGCNNGYMCFRASEVGYKRIVGIDSNVEAISIANYLNNHIYRREKIEFRSIDFYNDLGYTDVNTIFCSSFFHYSPDGSRVLEFFKRCHGILRYSGILIFEVELYLDMSKPKLDVSTRPAGGIVSYPNIPWILEAETGMFHIGFLNSSVYQPGSNYSRYFFHFIKE